MVSTLRYTKQHRMPKGPEITKRRQKFYEYIVNRKQVMTVPGVAKYLGLDAGQQNWVGDQFRKLEKLGIAKGNGYEGWRMVSGFDTKLLASRYVAKDLVSTTPSERGHKSKNNRAIEENPFEHHPEWVIHLNKSFTYDRVMKYLGEDSRQEIARALGIDLDKMP